MGRFFSAWEPFLSRVPGEGVCVVEHAVQCAPLAGLKLAFFSDIHASPRFSDAALEALFARVDALGADAVCVGGDFAEDARSLGRLLPFFSLLHPRLGIFACKGNNDSEIEGFEAAVRPYMRLLVNRSVELGGLWIGGVDERKWGVPRAGEVFPAGARGFRVLLAHYPVAHSFAGGARADLQLSGHTHGGQACVLGVSPYTFFFEPRRHAWISGECVLGGVRAIVSNGVGMSRVCLRVGVPPQVHLIRFVA